MSHSTIHFEKNTVTKTSKPEQMRIEVEKTLRARDIGENCGLFHVPKVLDFDKEKGVTVFERIHDINPVLNFLRNTKKCNSIIEQMGISLAIIHKELTLPYDMIIKLPPEFRLEGTEVFLHGDFNGINIGVIPKKPSIIILDWQMTSIHGGEATYGSRYFDLIWFINYLLWTPTIKYLFNIPVNKVAKLFLESYFKEASLPYDANMIIKYSKNFFRVKLPERKQHACRQKRYLLPYYNILTKRFIKSLDSINV